MSGAAIYFEGKWRSQTFTTSGTFNVPDSVDAVFVEMYGGGGGGARGDNVTTTNVSYGGEGASNVSTFVSVTAGGSVSVTIGSGGLGATTPGFGGGDGGDTSFDSVIAKGAKGGSLVGFNVPDVGGVGRNGNIGIGGTKSTPGGGGLLFGGDGSYGNGGNGSVSSPTAGGIGAGGGGSYNANAANGGSGICIVHYKEN